MRRKTIFRCTIMRGTSKGIFLMEEDLPRDPQLRDRIILAIFGSPTTPSIPKIIFIAPSQDFKTITGKEINKNEVDLVARALAMEKMHKAFPVTGGIPAAAASAIPGSIIHEFVGGSESRSEGRKLIIGHPSGKFDVEVKARQEGDQVRILSCTVGRTARKIMEGRVYIPRSVYFSVK